MTETVAPYGAHIAKVGELIIDEDTGEVIEWPEGIADVPERLAFLTQRMIECTRQEKLWKSYKGMLGSVAGALLAKQGIERYGSEYGYVSFRSRTTETAYAEQLEDWAARHEIAGNVLVGLAAVSAKSLDPSRLRDSGTAAGIDADAIEELIETKTSTWVEAREGRRAAPEKERA